MRKFTDKKLVIASHNKGKIREIIDLLKRFDVEVVSSSDFNLLEPEETGKTFIENAEIKAKYTAESSKLPSLSDDSGLVVPELNGEPGIYSARWAGERKDFHMASEKIRKQLIELTGTDKNHDAHFVSALSLCWPDGHIESFEGKVYGKLVFPGRGSLGFGYDPIFIPNRYDVTFGEMQAEEKHRISHRAIAFRKLVAACFE